MSADGMDLRMPVPGWLFLQSLLHFLSLFFLWTDNQISEFKASLVYKVGSRTARVTQSNPVSKKNFFLDGCVVLSLN